MTRPEDVLNLHADLLARLGTEHEDTMLANYIRTVVRSQYQEQETASGRRVVGGLFGGMPRIKTELSEAMEAQTVPVLREALRVGRTFHVTAEMAAVIEAAAPGLDSSDRFDRQVAPSGSGFVWLDGPGLPVVEVHGRTERICAFAWAPMIARTARIDGEDRKETPGVSVWYFNDYERPDEIAQIDMLRDPATSLIARRYAGRWAFMSNQIYVDGQMFGVATVEIPEDVRAEYAQTENPAGLRANTFHSPIRYVHTFWLMLNQTIAAVAPHAADRATAKRMKRAGLPSEVTVVQLRRRAHRPDEEPRTVERDHRWLVDGHWFWCPCGKDYPGAQERENGYRARIWRHGHVRGPADAPLVVKPKIYRLGR